MKLEYLFIFLWFCSLKFCSTPHIDLIHFLLHFYLQFVISSTNINSILFLLSNFTFYFAGKEGNYWHLYTSLYPTTLLYSWPLKQHGFELCGFTCMWVFSNSKFYSTGCSWLNLYICVTTDTEPWTQMANSMLYKDFFQLWRESVVWLGIKASLASSWVKSSSKSFCSSK